MKKSISIILAILMCFSCCSIISFAETTDSEHITTVPEGYVGIYTKDDLDNIKLDSHGKYILMNDIVFTEEDYAEGGSFYNSGKGWSPIPSFWGIFNGNGYVIYNLTINNPKADYQGLFGQATTATICNVTLINAKITGGNYTSGICGRYSGRNTISNCIVSGTIAGKQYVGGICGKLESTTSTLITPIDSCVNFADISGTYEVGGICGNLYSYVSTNYNNVSTYYPVKISQCINAGNITAKYTDAGGIVGLSLYYKNIVENSYNTGTISGTNSGGIVGYNCSVQKSYSIGTAKTGTICGDETSATKYCYYLDSVEYSTTNTNGIGKSHDQMVKQTTYAGWDFDTVWTMEGREDYPYPELRNVPLIFPDELNHEHEYSSEITTPATHLTEGVMTYTCSCGDTYTEAIAKTTEHTYSTIVTEPTCTDRGFTLYFCACNDFYMADYVEANGHSHTIAITTPATHLAEGVITYTCSCGDTYTEAIAKTTEHTYNAVVTAPTCTEKGYTTYTCKCGDSYVADYIDATGHSHTATVTTPATHLTEGLLTYTCTCGDTYAEAIAKITEHTFTEEIITESTCTAKGKKLFTCECGYSYSEEIAKTSHVNANGDYACDICGNNICSHMCHKSGFMGFIWKIVRFFWKIFGMNPLCECGAQHY